jgi:DNA excision repair protein ERCC-5
MASSAIAGRVEHSKPVSRKKVQPLFDLDEDDELRKQQEDMEEDDAALVLAIQESLEHKEASDLQLVMDASQQDIVTTPLKRTTSLIQEDEVFSSPGRLETALAIANAGPLPSRISSLARPSANFNAFGRPSLLLSNPATLRSTQTESVVSEDDMEEVPVVPSLSADDTESIPNRLSRESSLEYVELETSQTQDVLSASKSKESLTFNIVPSDYKELSDSDEDMEEVVVRSIPPAQSENTIDSRQPSSIVPRSKSLSPLQATFTDLQEPNAVETTVADPFKTQEDELDHEEPLTDWSRSPSPVARPAAASISDTSINPPPQAEEHWDAAQEMDPEAEQGEFARFMSQMKGRNLDDVRREIEDEIKGLKQQKKIAMRDSDDITQNMITQIMVFMIYSL